MSDRITLLRTALLKENLDGFIVPVNDEFMGEYVPDSAKRLKWLTGFTGSAGLAVVLKDKAAFFTDGRYTLQAKAEISGFELYNCVDMSPEQWLAGQSEGAVVGYDPKLHTLYAIKRYERSANNIKWQEVFSNPIDSVWENRPAAPASKAIIQPIEYAGQSSSDKRRRIANDIISKGGDTFILTEPDSVCWLLNLRGADVPFTPYLLCNAIIDKSGAVELYIDKGRISDEVSAHLGQDVTIRSPENLAADLAALKNKVVIYDTAVSPAWFYYEMKDARVRVIEGSDPCKLPKACKNDVELEGMRQVHIHDGLAVTRFLCWLDMAVADGERLTEISVADKLEEFRKVSALYLYPSFPTISGNGPNGAIVHYHATKSTNRVITENSLLLMDSGGQYQGGTTDITRTVAIGKPTHEMKRHFTKVLKGHIALARAIFPEGTSGSQLDVLARQYLWREGLDYDHGTGHGVGSYLSVHEGPQRIGKRGGDAALMPGMVVSNEPGYYRTDEYGIRIESLLVVKNVPVSEDGKRYFGFETITLAPIDLRLVDRTMLTEQESSWLQEYHQKIAATYSTQLNQQEKDWINGFC